MKRFYCLMISLFLVLATPVLAQTPEDAVADQARAATGGRVLSVQASANPDSPGFEVKILLPDGTVQILFYPAQ